ncbi:MAG: CBS domain-containing protein [Tannerellaceae bacterium]|nr:CBS domain-containing protein [Tannerellaceae bacterium]
MTRRKTTDNSVEPLSKVPKFHNTMASGIMTSRLDMETLDIQSSFPNVIDFVIRSGYSRIPVYEGTEDHIKGILYIKDLLPHTLHPDPDFRWQTLIRPAYFVPETKKIGNLLEELRTGHFHIAIVVDEFGCTSGLVTMEDILEEIVGDISDEYDDDKQPCIRLADGSFIFEAKTLLSDFFRLTGADETVFRDYTQGVETLAGMLLEMKESFPLRREVIIHDKYRFQILETDDRRILKVKYSLQ